MINSCKTTKAINSFQYTYIPSPRDTYARYGFKQSLKGECSCDASGGGTPAMVSSSSVIDQLINANTLLESSVGNN